METDINILELPDLEKARTCNLAAALTFPEAAKAGPAFVEMEESPQSIPSHLQLLDLHDDFWAITLQHLVYVRDQGQFRQYSDKTGLYTPVQEATLIGQLISNLNECTEAFPNRLIFESFLALKNRSRLKGVVERAKDLLAVDGPDFFRNRAAHSLYVANGRYSLANQKFTPFSPDTPIQEKLPVKFDPEAKCDVFLNGFLAHILSEADIDILQQYCSQMLLGQNEAQKILVLTGESGWGKSTLMKVLGTLLGYERVAIVREQLYRDASELGHYASKHLIYAPDMPTQFLNRKEASIFKQLVGNDPLWAEDRTGQRIIIDGTFPVVLACNGRPQIHIDQDVEAWSRRLIVLQFKRPANHDKHLGKMAELLIKTELSGILNWLLEGYAKLLKNSQQLTLNQEQQTRTSLLLIGSESPTAFVQHSLVKKEGGVMGAAELYENYQKWCGKQELPPFSAKEFHKLAKPKIEIKWGLKYRHDLKDDSGTCMRGWKGLAFVEENAEKESKESGLETQVKPSSKANSAPI